MIPDERELRARKALYDWERDEALDHFMGNPKFKRISRQLALDYSLFFEDWVNGFDVFIKPNFGSEVAKGVKKIFGKKAAGAAIEGIEGISDVLSLIPPYIERALPRQLTPDKLSSELGKKYVIERSLLYEAADIFPEPMKSYMENERKYSDVAQELAEIYEKDITTEDIHSAIRSVFRTKDEYLRFHKERGRKAVKCIEYFETELGKSSVDNPQLLIFFGSFIPLKRYIRLFGELEEDIIKSRSEEIF